MLPRIPGHQERQPEEANSMDPKRSLKRRLLGGHRIRRLLCLVLIALPTWLPTTARSADLEREPINYGKAPADNAVSRLQGRIDAGQVRLAFEDHFGYLRAL